MQPDLKLVERKERPEPTLPLHLSSTTTRVLCFSAANSCFTDSVKVCRRLEHQHMDHYMGQGPSATVSTAKSKTVISPHSSKTFDYTGRALVQTPPIPAGLGSDQRLSF